MGLQKLPQQKEGHQVKACPQRNKTADTQEKQEGTGGSSRTVRRDRRGQMMSNRRVRSLRRDRRSQGRSQRKVRCSEEGQEGTGGGPTGRSGGDKWSPTGESGE